MSAYTRNTWRDAWVQTKQQLFAPDFIAPFLAGVVTFATVTGILSFGLFLLLC